MCDEISFSLKKVSNTYEKLNDDVKQPKLRGKFCGTHEIFKNINFDSTCEQIHSLVYTWTLFLALCALVECSTSSKLCWIDFICSSAASQNSTAHTKPFSFFSPRKEHEEQGGVMLLRDAADRWGMGNECRLDSVCLSCLPSYQQQQRDSNPHMSVYEWKSIILFDFKWKYYMPHGREGCECFVCWMFLWHFQS